MSNTNTPDREPLGPDTRSDEQLLEAVMHKNWSPYEHDALTTLLERHQDRFERLEHELKELRRDLSEEGIL